VVRVVVVVVTMLAGNLQAVQESLIKVMQAE
jgi:hypothetical protein